MYSLHCGKQNLHVLYTKLIGRLSFTKAEPQCSVGSLTCTYLRTGGRWFDPRFGQYSFRGLMIVI